MVPLFFLEQELGSVPQLTSLYINSDNFFVFKIILGEPKPGSSWHDLS